MQFETVAKIAGIALGMYASYRLTNMVMQAAVRAHEREKAKQEAKLPAVTRLIDNLDAYGEHVAKRIAILKSQLKRQVISLDEYNIQLLELTN